MRSPPQPARSCEDIVREHERLCNPLRLRPAKTAILDAQAQRLREKEAELRGRQMQKMGAAGASAARRSGSPSSASPVRPTLPGRSPPSGGRVSGVPARRPLMLLADRDVSGELRHGARGGGGGDPYSVINTLQRAAAGVGSGPPSPSSPGGGGGRRYVSPPRQSPSGRRSTGTSPTAPYASGRGAPSASSPLLRPPSIEAAVSSARARVQLEAAVASSQRGSPLQAPPPDDAFGAARALVMSLPPFVILGPGAGAGATASPPPPHQHQTAERQQYGEQYSEREQRAGDAWQSQQYQRDASPAASRDAFLPPPGLLAQMLGPSGGDGGRPRMAPWELGQQLQESLRK